MSAQRLRALAIVRQRPTTAGIINAQPTLFMVAHVTTGTNNLAAALGFYEVLSVDLGARRIEPNERISLRAVTQDKPRLGVAKQFAVMHAKFLTLGAGDI
jgi:hypothetical protein